MAISPRLATSTFLNIVAPHLLASPVPSVRASELPLFLAMLRSCQPPHQNPSKPPDLLSTLWRLPLCQKLLPITRIVPDTSIAYLHRIGQSTLASVTVEAPTTAFSRMIAGRRKPSTLRLQRGSTVFGNVEHRS